MNVKELKNKLDQLPDDLEVKMLLPGVEDWADIKINEISMVRIRKESLAEIINLKNEDLNKNHGANMPTDRKPEDLKEQEWEFEGPYKRNGLTDEEFHEVYEVKEAVLISNKSRGKTTMDRHGTIKY